VRLKADCSVWFGAVLRGDNEWIELGERSQIQDNCHAAYRSRFPDHHRAGLRDRPQRDSARLHDRRARADRHGRHRAQRRTHRRRLLVGAGALITEGKSFPEKSLIVGAPARAIRTLDEAAAIGIAAGADFYVRNFKRYAKGLKPIG
jgi:carbonic anhydrase/acetyltransferase-like protein (isoleucine patch superfamily)